MQKTHTISILVNDQPGVLVRVANLFSRRGFNIDSISVGNSEEKGLSRMVIVIKGDEYMLEQVTKQLHKLIDVIKVQQLSDAPMVAREIVLIKVGATPAIRAEISGVLEPFRASIVDVAAGSVIVQVTGDSEKIEALIELLFAYEIREIARTGVTGLSRGTVPALKLQA